MDHHPANWGKPLREQKKKKVSSVNNHNNNHTSHTSQPIVTGTSVLAIKYKDGIMMAADTLASYGSLARFRDVERLMQVGGSTIIGASGDISDYQYVQHYLTTNVLIDDFCVRDGHCYGPKHIYSFVSRLMYGRRNKFNPLWNTYICGGVSKVGKQLEPFLGAVDLRGTTWQSDCLATGYGAYIALPLLRSALEKAGGYQGLDEKAAKELLEDCMRVLFYRDARSLNKFQIGKVCCSRAEDEEEAAIQVFISEPYSVSTEWAFAEGIRGYGGPI
jgi:20S proteasome subunit beta 7